MNYQEGQVLARNQEGYFALRENKKWLRRVAEGSGRETRGRKNCGKRSKGSQLGDKEITRRAVSVVFALTVNPFSSQTEYTSLSGSRVGSDLERGTERLA